MSRLRVPSLLAAAVLLTACQGRVTDVTELDPDQQPVETESLRENPALENELEVPGSGPETPGEEVG